MAFEPAEVTGGRWACPCRDAYGHSAMLEPRDTTPASGGRIVRNFACDQNGDLWQQIVEADLSTSWHYIGRPRKAWDALT